MNLLLIKNIQFTKLEKLREVVDLSDKQISNFLEIPEQTLINFWRGKFQRQKELSEKIDTFLINCENIVFKSE